MISLVVDGNYLLHRCLHVPSLAKLCSASGTLTGGIFGFLKSLKSAIHYLKASKCVVVFDDGISKRRRSLYPAYKGVKYRDKDDPFYAEIQPEDKVFSDSLVDQRQILCSILEALGIPVVRIKGWEGDDLVYRISRHHTKPGIVYMMSDDMDYVQAVGSYRVSGDDFLINLCVYRPMADVLVTADNFDKEIGYPIEQFLLRKSILGDSSDKIPGVRGIGAKGLDSLFLEGAPVPKYPYEPFFHYCMMHRLKKIQRIADDLGTVLLNYELICFTCEEYPLDISDTVDEIVTANRVVDASIVEERFAGLQFSEFLKDFDSWLIPFQRMIL